MAGFIYWTGNACRVQKGKEPRNQVPRKVSINEEGLEGFLALGLGEKSELTLDFRLTSVLQ